MTKKKLSPTVVMLVLVVVALVVIMSSTQACLTNFAKSCLAQKRQTGIVASSYGDATFD